MKLKKNIALILTAAILVLALTACGAKTGTSESASQPAAESQPAETVSAEPVTIKLGVVGSIYEDLWTPAQEALKSEGVNLEFVQFSDYVTPNNALANGEIDLNAFQHKAYLAKDADGNGYDLTVVGDTLIAPLSLYSKQAESLDALKELAGLLN